MNKILAIAFMIMIAVSCGTIRSTAVRQEQAIVSCYIREANNRAIVKLITSAGKEVIWYDKKSGLGKAIWKEGEKYTIEFNEENKVVNIKKNQ